MRARAITTPERLTEEPQAPQTVVDLEEARDALGELEEEQSSIQQRIAAAVEDPDELLALRRRAIELPAHLYAAQVRVLRSAIADLERREQEARDRMACLAEPWEEARQRLEEAKRAWAEVNTATAGARSVAYNLGQDLAERRRQLALLLTRRH